MMKPIATNIWEENEDFLYEIKYDGFRCLLHWTGSGIELFSKNNHNLTANFPEIVECCAKYQEQIKKWLPLKLDGELVVLNNDYEANFSVLQKRGRLKKKQHIEELAKKRPATFIAFDLILQNNKSLANETLLSRKKHLEHLFKKITGDCIRLIHVYEQFAEIKELIFSYKGEGIVAKRKRSVYTKGKTHRDWFKIKNWRTISAILTAYDAKNDYFTVGVHGETDICIIGKCKHGLDDETSNTLQSIFIREGANTNEMYTLPPAICAQIHTLGLYGDELREPEFVRVLPETLPKDCTTTRLQYDLAMLPDIAISKEEKLFWPDAGYTKGDLLIFMREIFPYLIPHMKNRALTVIRCPDGIEGEMFFQKNLPNHAPDIVSYVETEDKRLQFCNNLSSLIWYANHGAIEYHLPFQQVTMETPTEIVFDLDPARRAHFPLAIQAAKLIKQLLDELKLISFVKTSGNKGLQIYVPIVPGMMTYDETAIFTEAIAKTTEQAAPSLFTTARFKRDRDDKLYIDYVQHGRNRTIIAPYSPRKTKEATVATPLYWEEVCEALQPTQFTIKNVGKRVQTLGCPWLFTFDAARNENNKHLLKWIRQ